MLGLIENKDFCNFANHVTENVLNKVFQNGDSIFLLHGALVLSNFDWLKCGKPWCSCFLGLVEMSRVPINPFIIFDLGSIKLFKIRQENIHKSFGEIFVSGNLRVSQIKKKQRKTVPNSPWYLSDKSMHILNDGIKTFETTWRDLLYYWCWILLDCIFVSKSVFVFLKISGFLKFTATWCSG